MSAPPERGERLYRRLLVLYPPAFRALFAGELAELMRDRLRAARADGTGGVVRLWSRVLPDLLITACLERWREARRPRFHPLETPARRPEPMMHAFAQDLRQAARGLLRQPMLALGVIAILALGIGANIALFGVVDAVLLRPLPFEEPERLVNVWNRYGEGFAHNAPPDLVDRMRAETLESVAATTTTAMSLSDVGGRPDQVAVAHVTSDLWRVLGVSPAVGRARFPAYDAGEETRLAVLSHGLWQRRFGGDRGVVGSEVRLDGEPHTIVGVMPPALDYPRGTDLWTPLTFGPDQLADDARGNEFLVVVARLASGRSLAEARAEMDTIAAQVIENVPERAAFLERTGWGAGVVPLEKELLGDSRPALLALFAAVGMVLLLACANVANILLTRSIGRRRELALRAALGADRRRLVTLLLGESALLALAAAVAGGALAWTLLRLVPRFVPHDIPRLADAALDARALAFAVAVAWLAALISGLVPAWRARSLASGSGMRVAGDRGDRRLQRALVVYEVATAMVLLIAAALLLRSFASLAGTDPGFRSDGRLAFRISLPANAYPDAESRRSFQQRLLDSLRALPGARRAALASRVPLDDHPWTLTFDVEGLAPAAGEQPGGDFAVVSPDYVETLGIPLVRGRTFSEADHADGALVVMVDAWAAERYWPGGDPLGRRINLGASDDPIWRTVVGVVGHVKKNALDERGRPQLYLPSTQGRIRQLHVTVESDGDALALVPAIRAAVAELAPDLPVFDVRTLDRVVAVSIALPRFNMQVLGAFAVVALILAAAGLYGVLAYTVERRRAEIGVRMAIGATASAIVRGVVGDGLRLVSFGVVLGTAGALASARLLRGLLYGIAPNDPATYALIVAVLLTVATAAATLPARRAARLDPVVALREE